jgi:hypothetical protein
MHKVMRHYHTILLKEYVWLLCGRMLYAAVYVFWGFEMLIRSFCVVFRDTSPLRRFPLELLPFGVGILEVIINFIVIVILELHPWHAHWIVDIAGYLTLVKHSIIFFCYGLFAVSIVVGCKTGFDDKKLE